MIPQPPKVFISYSHDDEDHENWTLALATRLINNGVDVVLDQWDLTLGSDLPSFMEKGLTDSDRVIAICSKNYVEKANKGDGGVGYEKMILTATLIKNINDNRIIPLIRNNPEGITPTFLLSKVYINFQEDKDFEEKYVEIIKEIHGQNIKPRPAIGKNPFDNNDEWSGHKLEYRPERYVSPALTGKVTFDYKDNNGKYIIGAGDMEFETSWSGASNKSIHAYRVYGMRTLAIAEGVTSIQDIGDASSYNTSSSSRTPAEGEVVVLQNSNGYFVALLIEDVKSRGHGDEKNEITFSYIIQQNKTASFEQ